MYIHIPTLTLLLPDMRIYVKFSTVYNDMLVVKGLNDQPCYNEIAVYFNMFISWKVIDAWNIYPLMNE